MRITALLAVPLLLVLNASILSVTLLGMRRLRPLPRFVHRAADPFHCPPALSLKPVARTVSALGTTAPVVAVAAQPGWALTVGESSQECPPWVIVVDPVGAYQGDFALEYPKLSGDRFLLVAPLWREDDRYRVILGVYGAKELALPPGSVIHRVLVPRAVARVEDGVITRGPWREVRYSLRASGEFIQLQPEETMDGVFVVEAGLPARDGRIRIALTPGHWLVALGWALDFNLLTPDGKTIPRSTPVRRSRIQPPVVRGRGVWRVRGGVSPWVSPV